MAVVAVAVSVGLSRIAKQRLIEAKLHGAEMVVDNMALALAPALDFGDSATVAEYAERFSATRDVSQVVVWNQLSSQPVFAKHAAPPMPAASSNESRIERSQIVLTRLLKTPMGGQVGRVEAHFSLTPENRSFRQLRAKIVLLTAVLAIVVAATIIVIARFSIVLRLKQLLAAMVQLRNGQTVAVDASALDEIGELVLGFNEMANAIRDRESKLSIERDNSHQLLDNMRQAILVVDHEGRITDVRSRQAAQLFGKDKQGHSIAELLCDDARPAIERQAFVEWLDTAFSLGHRNWPQVSNLAPSEAIVSGIDGQEHILTLDVRPIVLEDRLIRIMFLCTDVTAQRALEQTVQKRDVEHDRQMRVMRALVAGNGQQLVATLRNVEDRLTACRKVLETSSLTSSDVNEVFEYVHSIKGDASAFELESLVQASAVMEAELSNYRIEAQHAAAPEPAEALQTLREALTRVWDALEGVRAMLVTASPLGADILDQVTVRLSDLVALDQACTLGSPDIRELVNRVMARRFGELLLMLVPAGQRWAQRLSKEIALEVEGRNVLVPRELARVLPAILAQLVRNAVSHGIETPGERQSVGKPTTGLIQLICLERGRDVEVRVVDDGRGLDEDRLQAFTTIEARQLSTAETAFLPGMSTADDATTRSGIAGCGVGLGAVRSELARLDYCVDLKSVPGKGVDVRLFHRSAAGVERSVCL